MKYWLSNSFLQQFCAHIFWENGFIFIFCSSRARGSKVEEQVVEEQVYVYLINMYFEKNVLQFIFYFCMLSQQ